MDHFFLARLQKKLGERLHVFKHGGRLVDVTSLISFSNFPPFLKNYLDECQLSFFCVLRKQKLKELLIVSITYSRGNLQLRVVHVARSEVCTLTLDL